MGPYDHRHVTLDPGLTALALRGLAEREGQYPFLERFGRRRARCGKTVVSAPPARRETAERPHAGFWPRSLRAADLFPTLSRFRGLRAA
jgi:hypothetical protein